MELNPILQELKVFADFDWVPEQKAFYIQRFKDAKPVKCVRMREVLAPDQLEVLSKNIGYRAHRKACYKNAADLVNAIEWMALHYNSNIPEAKYVEGITMTCGILIEHAFVKIGDKYVDPTFERALRLDVHNEVYVSLIELDHETMNLYEAETGYYGELYQYDYLKKYKPELARKLKKN